MKRIVLAIDCSTTGLSLALEKAGETHVFSTPVARSSDLLPTELNNLLMKSDTLAHEVSHIYVTTGPGSFTGIRLGLATAEAIKLLNNKIEIMGLSTLKAHALQVAGTHKPTGPYTIVLDAAGGQVYCQTFDEKGEKQSEAACTAIAGLPSTPLYAEPTLLLSATALQLLNPLTLLEMASSKENELAPTPVYLKPLTYKPAS